MVFTQEECTFLKGIIERTKGRYQWVIENKNPKNRSTLEQWIAQCDTITQKIGKIEQWNQTTSN